MNGASGRNRTTDTGIFSPLLYLLSYRSKTLATRKGLEPSTSSVTGWRTNQLYYRATFVNGNNRARTCDPLLVRQMLSQLSYAPTFAAFCCRFPRAHHRGDKRYNTLYRAFCQYLFSKKSRFFLCLPNRALRGVEARFHPAQGRVFSALLSLWSADSI